MQTLFRGQNIYTTHRTTTYTDYTYVYTFATTLLILFKVHEQVTIQISQSLIKLGLVAYIALFYK